MLVIEVPQTFCSDVSIILFLNDALLENKTENLISKLSTDYGVVFESYAYPSFL